LHAERRLCALSDRSQSWWELALVKATAFIEEDTIDEAPFLSLGLHVEEIAVAHASAHWVLSLSARDSQTLLRGGVIHHRVFASPLHFVLRELRCHAV
jgi:hypothetical protein